MADYEYIGTMQYRLKAQAQVIAEFESGERYVRMEAEHRSEVKRLLGMIKKLERELEEARRETARVRKLWMEANEDVVRECEKKIARMNRFVLQVIADNADALRQRDDALAQKREKQLRIYELETLLLEEQEKNKKLIAQINRDFENSSIPSSMQGPRRKNIPNSREKTGRKPGAQPGHEGHSRKRHVPTESHEIPAPQFEDDPDYYATGKWIRKQKLVIRMEVGVIEYFTKEYRQRSTGARVHAPFPDGFVDDVNYDGTVKAFAFMLGNECNVSHEKIKKLISELTNGEIDISVGMINNLCREFSEKTEPEKKEIINRLMDSPVMNADFTNANVNGKSAQVLVLASPSEDVALYIGREKKGHKGIQGTPLEDYAGTVVHDHDSTFYHYGTRHQECMQHNCRYLVGSEQNEPEREWNRKMHALVKEMLHYRNGLSPGETPDADKVGDFEARYDEILNEAQEEYKDEPPGKYYMEGYNLYLRLKKYKDSELLFLHDTRVPANNSLCERLARVYKRKQKQAIVLRSQDQLGYICDGLSTVYLLRSKDSDVYHELTDIFNRKRPEKSI